MDTDMDTPTTTTTTMHHKYADEARKIDERNLDYIYFFEQTRVDSSGLVVDL